MLAGGMVKASKAPARRTRRTPEEARANILDAAERVFATRTPDVVGLKEVAQEAAVTHGLITHYFGTYEALVDEALSRRLSGVRTRTLARLAATMIDDPESALVEAISELVADAVSMRLLLWMMLRDRARVADAPFVAGRSLAVFADALEARARAASPRAVSRARIEFTLMAAINLVVGFGAAGDLLSASLGRPAPLSPAEVAARVNAMMRAYVFEGASVVVGGDNESRRG
jgi:TetR/AcrR family transcriptional regulator, repressor for neighboring sulfatase